ncbi:MAG: diacylglycerol kinase family lipid kinase [Dehalococcoidia bacterium]
MAKPLYAKIIVNPYAGTGATGRKSSRIKEILTEAGLDFDYVYTEGKDHAVELAREAALSGYELVVAVGGDGTLSEVVNGLIQSGHSRDITMGILNTGTGCDFARFLDIPRDFRQACARLVNPQKVSTDVGVVQCQRGGEPFSRYFISAASLGFDGEVVEIAEKRPRLFHGNTSYFMGVIEVMGTYRNKNVLLKMDEQTEELRICSLVIANAGSYASGMRIVPEADLSDGLFEVVIVGDINKFELMQILPKAYLGGTHTNNQNIRLEKASYITVESEDRVLIQADGDLVGEAPAQFCLLPSALNIAL